MAEKLSLVCDGIEKTIYEGYSEHTKEKRTYIIQDDRLIKADELSAKSNFPHQTWEKLKWKCAWKENSIGCFFETGNIKSYNGRISPPSIISIDRMSGQINSIYYLRGILTSFEGHCKVSKKNKF